MKFKEGEIVLAKHPESDDFQKGKVITARGDRYRIMFEGGEEYTLYGDSIQPERPSRSTGRAKGRPRKSPSRKSPSRKSPSRRSPSRRSPGRSSNTRVTKLPSKTRSDDEKSFKTDSQSTMSETDEIGDLVSISSRSKEGPVARRRSVRIRENLMKTEGVFSTRSIDRAASLPVERKSIMYEYLLETKERGFSVQREPEVQKLHYEEDVLPDSSTHDKAKKEIEIISQPQEWGGWFGTLCLIFILPVAVILPQVACFNNKCLLSGYHMPQKWQSYLNIYAILVYLGLLLSVSILSVVPIGAKVDGQQSKVGRLQYRINGLLIAIIIMVAIGVGEYHGYKVFDYILRSTFKFTIGGWIIGTILAIGLYIRGGKIPVSNTNIYASTGNFIYDFWQGRVVNPRIGKLDIKMVLIRTSIIATIIINTAIIAKSLQGITLETLQHSNKTIIIASGMQILYCLDALIYEITSLTSFRIMYEGTGYMTCVGNLLYPFLITLGPRYLLMQKINQPNVLHFVGFTFLVGYLIYRLSNLQKDKFRTNPYLKDVSHLDTILTNKGKKIIVSGLWGFVRRPNYFGDLIINWSMACTASNGGILPYYPAICCTLVLIHRAVRDDARCKARYGAAWEQYCSRVKSLILKGVF
ncbi:delta(14)-sterol reductase TM7SF2 [Chelonus insularis]|uniref:delta(14)-sterol reductase TM7SF2 n=1 Tax=Chelonus insularis TaxID=460826 RepID=UPI00158E8641|nr:delta(14)-sterol reductase TM7SF2 [Chelonus insularis]XP_034950406.1 delta(14)-sterol reductase TM7SF2 [Chelonus insularis]